MNSYLQALAFLIKHEKANKLKFVLGTGESDPNFIIFLPGGNCFTVNYSDTRHAIAPAKIKKQIALHGLDHFAFTCIGFIDFRATVLEQMKRKKGVKK